MEDLLYILFFGFGSLAYLVGVQLLHERLSPLIDNANFVMKYVLILVLITSCLPVLFLIGYVLYIFVEALFFGGIDCWPGKYGECD